MTEYPTGFLDLSCVDFEGDVEDQISNLLNHVRLSRQDVVGLRNLLSDLENALRKSWPYCEVQPFGSIVTGLGIRSSDFDVYVNIPASKRLQPVMVARNILRKLPWIFSNVFAIPQAKIPIVKFYHIPTNCYCDVNFTSENGVRNSKLIYTLLQTDRRVLNLAIIVKYWSKVYQITGTNLLASYALTMLVIFYFQGVELLSPIANMQRSVEPWLVDNWNTAFDKTYQHPNRCKDSLYHLLGGFFKYYSNFQFETNVVSTYIGAPIPKTVFQGPVENLPQEYWLYKENVQQNRCKPMKVDTLMVIQDPFEHSRNCSVAVSEKLFRKIMFHIQYAAKMYDQMHPNEFFKSVFTQSSRPNIEPPRPTHNTVKLRPTHTIQKTITSNISKKNNRKRKNKNTLAQQYIATYKKNVR